MRYEVLTSLQGMLPFLIYFDAAPKRDGRQCKPSSAASPGITETLEAREVLSMRNVRAN